MCIYLHCDDAYACTCISQIEVSLCHAYTSMCSYSRTKWKDEEKKRALTSETCARPLSSLPFLAPSLLRRRNTRAATDDEINPSASAYLNLIWCGLVASSFRHHIPSLANLRITSNAQTFFVLWVFGPFGPRLARMAVINGQIYRHSIYRRR